MLEAPELVFANGSELHRQLHAMPQEFVDYFDPMLLPTWVDPDKLAVAARLWRENSLGMLVVLFLGSLPACYLMARGIPALYQTDKLADPRYISQRIYETGLFLEAVLDPGGMRVLTDVPDTPHERFLAQLQQLDPAGEWVAEGRTLRRKTGATPSSVRPEHVHRELHDRGTAHAGRRFLWGRGYITTKKVRFLHASMRYMLLHPQQFHASHGGTAPPTNLAQVIARRTHAWDVQSLGLPVNQEDLAYTLLTFGYMIPLGLEHWGCRFSTPEKEAFLHHWRLIGHVLGVEDELMTDDWTAAGQLYERIQRHQAAASPDGIALTRTLTNFLEDYLPKLGGLNRTLPPLAIADLVGANATMLFTPADWQAARSPAKQLVWATSRTTLRWFNWTRSLVARHLPGVANFYSAIIFRVSDELVQSCWGGLSPQTLLRSKRRIQLDVADRSRPGVHRAADRLAPAGVQLVVCRPRLPLRRHVRHPCCRWALALRPRAGLVDLLRLGVLVVSHLARARLHLEPSLRRKTPACGSGPQAGAKVKSSAPAPLQIWSSEALQPCAHGLKPQSLGMTITLWITNSYGWIRWACNLRLPPLVCPPCRVTGTNNKHTQTTL